MSLRDHLRPAAAAAAVLLALGLAACGDDDGGEVRGVEGDDCPAASASASASASPASGETTTTAASGSASASASATDECASASSSGSAAEASGSASGIEEEDVAAETDDELVLAAVADYETYVTDQVDELIAANTEFTNAVRAGDLALAQSLFAPARAPWERIEPIAALISDIDGAVDARVDDFASEEDPAWTGWHRIEYLLWETGDIDAAAPFADQLDADLLTLQATLPDLELPPAALAVGAAELIQEVSEGKITGEEDRYSHTDLSDFEANVQGAQVLIDFLRPALEEADAGLLGAIDQGFTDLLAELGTHRGADGTFVLYTELTEDDIDALVALLAPLSEDMALVAGTLDLD
jgi:iron uptake system component EfeO